MSVIVVEFWLFVFVFRMSSEHIFVLSEHITLFGEPWPIFLRNP